MENIIQAHNLTKRYGDFVAVDGISFNVRQGETFGILGPNGAGKTTTLEMLEGLKSITSGQASVDGLDVAQNLHKVKSIIGVQLQSSTFFDGLNLSELLETYAAMYRRKVDTHKLLEEVQLLEKAGNKAKELSGGQKQRLSIAVALVNEPKVVFLDEPTTGLDPQARRNLWQLVENIKRRGTTVVLTTHYMDEAEILCDRIAIMDNAKIVELDTTGNLLKNSGVSSSIHFRLKRPVDIAQLNNLTAAENVKHEGEHYGISSKEPSKTLVNLLDLSQKNNWELLDLQLKQPTLEDVFLKLTGHALRE